MNLELALLQIDLGWDVVLLEIGAAGTVRAFCSQIHFAGGVGFAVGGVDRRILVDPCLDLHLEVLAVSLKDLAPGAFEFLVDLGVILEPR
ncbi:hypothetical protein C491_20966 [Natronococcus amylolyticus DSM 10524]|uniref:Uncharacterized protein n=1 Tax=Natronococcus amylolyticus DSM 10524 TaxID=1227497 RepID=L9WWT9_9EURY|nr:hypothetical protein [Natronococcus amylolyticus]ELY53651.1 hypothetical protein C491_20966 [Natronococcus amylolyticus DSM 10524]